MDSSVSRGRTAPALALLVLLALLLATVAGCAAGDRRFDARPAGFWAGLWHGLICVIAFVISLFSDGVRVYEAHNSGHLYDLGFLLGAMIFFGGSPFGILRKRRC
jgi:hypothetical protein